MIALLKPLIGVGVIVWLFWQFGKDMALGVIVYLVFLAAAVGLVWWVGVKEGWRKWK